MVISFVNVGIAVRDLGAAVDFFTDLGLRLVGRDEVSGTWADTAVGLDGNHAKVAVLQTPDGGERSEWHHRHARPGPSRAPGDLTAAGARGSVR